MPEIVITRGGGYVDHIRAYKVYIDDDQRGSIRCNEIQRFSVPEGPHKVRLRIDWCTSPELSIDVGSDDVHLACGSNVNPFLALFYLFMPHKWVWLRET
jgi:hypothetical protein